MTAVEGDAPGVSVVVVTHNRRQELVSALRRLLSDSGAAEVIVVDNASTDGSAEAAARLGARVERLAANAGAAGRNRGVDLATTAYVAFSDDDSWWARGALARGAAHLDRDRGLGLVAGHILVGAEEIPDPVSVAMGTGPLADAPGSAAAVAGAPVLGFLACGAVVRKRALQDVGGFPDGYLVGGEEQPVTLALASRGWGLRYFPDVVAHHWPSPVRDPASRERRVTRNDLWTAWRFRPRPAAVRLTASAVARGARHPARRAGLVDALRGAVGPLAARRPVPEAVEAQLRLLGH